MKLFPGVVIGAFIAAGLLLIEDLQILYLFILFCTAVGVAWWMWVANG